MMQNTLWRLRTSKEPVDVDTIYRDYGNFFCMQINHGGCFSKSPGRKYYDGKITYVDNVDVELFSVYELHAMVEEIGYTRDEVMYYYYVIPDFDLDFGLQALANDQDVLNMATYVPNHKLIRVYIEHGQTKLLEIFFRTPIRPRTVEEIEVVKSPEYNRDKKVRKEVGSSSKKIDFDLNKEFDSSQIIDLEDEGQTSYSIVPYQGPTQSTMASQVNDMQEANVEVVNEQPVPQANLNIENEVDYFDQIFDLGVGSVAYEGDIEDDYEVNMEADFEINMVDGIEDSDDENSDSDGSSGRSSKSGKSNSDSDFNFEAGDHISDVEVDMDEFRSVVDPHVEDFGRQEETIAEVSEVEVINTDKFVFCGVEEDERKRMLANIRKPNICSAGGVHEEEFAVGDTFMNKQQVKEAITNLAISSKRNLRLAKNDKTRIRAVCMGEVQSSDASGPSKSNKDKDSQKGKGNLDEREQNKCPWVLHVSRSLKEDEWMVKTYEKTHTCRQSRKIKKCTQGFLASNIYAQIEGNPKIPVPALRDELEKKYKIKISLMKVFRAKVLALNRLHGDYERQYSMLRDYVLELQTRNPGTTVKIEVESQPNISLQTRQFKRIYICLGPLKQGFKAGLRDFLGLDGAFMKGPFPGQVLTAVGLDGNNGVYPVAYAIVEAERKDSWIWFLECLGQDLELSTNSNFTFISDRQKGLIPALVTVFPSAEHRYCVRHIHENMKSHWRCKPLKDHIWRCASATTIPHFARAMEELKKFHKPAYEWLNLIPPKHWSRSHFTGRAHSDLLLNNLCEVFNGKIVDGRDRPIISAVEFIRVYIMKKIVTVQKLIDKSSGPITPTAQDLVDEVKEEATKCTAIYTGNGKYQVQGEHADQFVVNMTDRTCSCRKWELSGIPCKHAVCAVWDMADHSQDVGLPEDLVHPCYKMETWKNMYRFTIDPINGPDMWVNSECPTTITPPNHHKQVGRPKKKRTRGAFEEPSQSSNIGTKLSRKYMTVTCSKCHNKGHNSRSCKGQGGPNDQPTGSRAAGVGVGTSARGASASTRGRGRGPSAPNRGRGRGGRASDRGRGVGTGSNGPGSCTNANLGGGSGTSNVGGRGTGASASVGGEGFSATGRGAGASVRGRGGGRRGVGGRVRGRGGGRSGRGAAVGGRFASWFGAD